MHTRKRRGALLAALAFALLLAGRSTAAAQDEGGGPAPRQQAAKGAINYEVQLHVLVTAEGSEGAPKVPPALEGVVRQLKAAFPPAEYRVGATFFNRVQDGSGFDVRSMGPPPYAGSTLAAGLTTYQIVASVSGLTDGAAGERLVRVSPFRFGLRVPVQALSATGQSAPIIQYEDVGLNTHIGVRDGEPALVGTLNTSRPGQFFAVVLTVRRVGK
jgi:hypothetical protein